MIIIHRLRIGTLRRHHPFLPQMYPCHSNLGLLHPPENLNILVHSRATTLQMSKIKCSILCHISHYLPGTHAFGFSATCTPPTVPTHSILSSTGAWNTGALWSNKPFFI